MPFWRPLFWISVIVLVTVLAIACLTRAWILTALPVGVVFGFGLQRGDLCGAAAFSEVMLMRDGRKVLGLWVLIVVSMLGFAALESLGLVQLNPKPLLWARQLVGGLTFGAGMVLAGGCISGALYKTGMGNLNSMASLVGIPLGIGAVLSGPLSGLLAAPAYMSSVASGRNYPLGVTNGVWHVQQLVIDSQARIVWWLVLVVIGLVIGSWVSARLTGQARLLPKPPEQTVTAFFGGILVGIGAALAGGCYVGNIMSGIALMSVGMVVFTTATIAANWFVTWVYLMGGLDR